MSFQAQVIKIFVSSPGDVSGDRQVVLDEIQAWNQRNGPARGCFLTALTWEDLVAPDIGDSPQDVINLEVGDDYDVFLGLMWGKFGTPTPKANSGTQEEFERALARKSSLSDVGAYYGQYLDERELVSNLTTIFDKIANEKIRYIDSSDNPPKKSDESQKKKR